MFETADIRPVTTAREYEAALARISTLMDAEYGTPEGLELDILADYVAQYESAREPMVRYPSDKTGAGVAREELAERYPRLFHLAAGGSWPMIERHGLLSASGLLDLFGVSGGRRRGIESRRRPKPVTLRRADRGRATVRERRPLNETALKRTLCGRMSLPEWYEMLNAKAFFWPTRQRLETMLKAYAAERQTVLVVDTASLLDAHFDRVRLSPIDSGGTCSANVRRGPDTFLPPGEYPFRKQCIRRRASGAVAEIAVEGGVPDIREHVLLVEERGAGAPPRRVWRR